MIAALDEYTSFGKIEYALGYEGQVASCLRYYPKELAC